jgi:hypothetical protein
VHLLDLFPAKSDISEWIAVEGDFAGYFTHEFAVKRVSIAEHQQIGSWVWGRRGLSGAGTAAGEYGGKREKAKAAKKERHADVGVDIHRHKPLRKRCLAVRCGYQPGSAAESTNRE